MDFDEWYEDDLNNGDGTWEESLRRCWQNRQALIDAHNKRCEDACGESNDAVFDLGSCAKYLPNGEFCPDCPRRYMIEDK